MKPTNIENLVFTIATLFNYFLKFCWVFFSSVQVSRLCFSSKFYIFNLMTSFEIFEPTIASNKTLFRGGVTKKKGKTSWGCTGPSSAQAGIVLYFN